MATCTITYGETGTFESEIGERLLDAILTHRPEHRHLCGGNGFCTSCRVALKAGQLSQRSRLEYERLRGLPPDVRLACQSYLIGDVTVEPLVRASLIDWE